MAMQFDDSEVGKAKASLADLSTLHANSEIRIGRRRSADMSVIMRVYNSGVYINEAIKSLLEQDYKGKVELVIVYSNATSDNSMRVISDNLSGIVARGFSVKLITTAQRGAFRAFEYGIKAASGHFIAVLDTDNFYYKQKLSAQINFIRESGAHFTFTDYQTVNSSGRPTKRVMPPVQKEYWKLSNIAKFYYVDMNTIMFDTKFKKELLDAFRFLKSDIYDMCLEDYLIGMIAGLTSEINFIDAKLNAYRVWAHNASNFGGDKGNKLDGATRIATHIIATYAALARINAEMHLTSRRISMSVSATISDKPLKLSIKRSALLRK